MTLNKIWSLRIFVFFGMAILLASWANAQSWQALPSTDDRADSQDWEQRVLKRPETQQWRAVHHEASDQDAGTIKQTAWGSDRVADRSDRSAQSRDSDGRPAAARSIPVEVSNPGRQRARWVGGEEVIEPGIRQQQFEPLAAEGNFAGSPGCTHCGNNGGGGCDCAEPDGCGDESCGGQPCGKSCGDCCDFGYEVFDGTCGPWLRNFSFFAGGHAFKGPLDSGTNGNFGLQEGLNYAGPLGDPWGCGYQLGANMVQSDFSGNPTLTMNDRTVLRAADRKQVFLTAGLFRRELCWGLQGGLAYDYLHDDYYEKSDLQQLRSETSFVFDGSWELGYYGAYGVSSDHVANTMTNIRTASVKIDPSDMFCLFVRKNFENCGDGRVWVGATGTGDGLIGADIWMPLGKGFALQNEFNYLLPKQGTGDTAQPRESWGLVIQLVWYPGQTAMCQHKNPYRPIFNVADNSLFMVNRLATP